MPEDTLFHKRGVEMKQVILVRKDIKMSAGKKMVQACHASVGAALATEKKAVDAWSLGGSKKVVLAAKNEMELKSFYSRSKKLGVPCFLVADAGLTELEAGTVTALAIGPADDGKIDKLTGNVKLF